MAPVTRQSSRAWFRGFALSVAVIIGALTPAAGLIGAGVPIAAADAGCSLYAAPPADGGNDANPGTKAQPKASPIVLLGALTPGQTGCLKDGATFILGGGEAITSTAGTAGNPKTLRPETPGARATISASSGFWFQAASHDIVLRDLNLTRPGGTGGGSLMLLDGDRLILDGMDITYTANICLDIGPDARAGAVDPADDIVIRRSRIHDCGSNYGAPHEPNDSGVHGIYVQMTRRLLIEDNLIYRNHNRGIQLYPDADDSVIRFNVLHANGANLNIGSERDDGIYSERNLVQNNILTDSVLSGLTPGGFVGDTSEVLGNFPAPGPGVPDFGNEVTNNCIRNAAHPTELYEGNGIDWTPNIENQDPLYANPGAAVPDFTLGAGSPCAGKGPRAAGPLCNGMPATVPGLMGTAGNDVIIGTTGPDVIHGFGGNDTICALEGNDTAYGDGGNDTIFGDAGNDTVTGGAGDDSLNGGADTDTVSIADGLAATSVNLLGGNDSFCSGAAVCGLGYDMLANGTIESVFGSPFNDTIIGDERVNTLNGAGGNDTLDGQAANDTLIGGPANDTLMGGSGLDTAWYGNAPGPVTVDLALAGPQPTVSAGSDALNSVENLSGSPFADTLSGNGGPNYLYGMNGDDDLNGVGGNDFLYGQAGFDTLVSGPGNDTLSGGADDDDIDPGADTDTVSVQDGLSGVTVDLRNGGSYCNDGAPVSGGGTCGLGFDQYLGSAPEQVLGSPFGDKLFGSPLAEVFYGLGGNDTILADDGNDTLSGGANDDTLDGGLGVDAVSVADALAAMSVNLLGGNESFCTAAGPCGLGYDVLVNGTIESVVGSAFVDNIVGDERANTLNGAGGNDIIDAQGGNDTIFGGPANDTLNGGAGTDIAYYSNAPGAVTVDLALGGAQPTGNAGADTLNSIEGLYGSAFADTLSGNGSANLLYGFDGDDQLNGLAGNDKLYGQLGVDTLNGGADTDVCDVGPNGGTVANCEL